MSGELLLTAGLVLALFIAYELWVTDISQAHAQDRLRHELTHAWAAAPSSTTVPAPPPPQPAAPAPAAAVPEAVPGGGIAVLRIPRFGTDYAPVVVEGVSSADLKRGPGHNPGTAMPGQVGNFVVSGHRTTYGRPFARLGELQVGDAIVVEMRDRFFTYRVTGSEVVAPDRVDVMLPVPEKPGETAAKPMLTLTTCHPAYSASSRLVVFAELAETTLKSTKSTSAGTPASPLGR